MSGMEKRVTKEDPRQGNIDFGLWEISKIPEKKRYQDYGPNEIEVLAHAVWEAIFIRHQELSPRLKRFKIMSDEFWK